MMVTDSYRVLVLGSGFAGLWSALGAARRLDELDAAGTVDVTVISAQPFHDIRVRNYEADLSACRIPLGDVLDPADVGHIAAEVTAIDTEMHTVTVSDHGTPGTQRYDRLVMALGSRVAEPDIPGLREFGFDVDTYDGAMKLQRHLAALSDGRPDTAAATAVVVGAGLTGIETASELPARLAKVCAGRNVEPRVVLIDHNPHIGSDMGASARPVIEAALSDNGVETMTGVGVAAVGEDGVTLSSGDVLTAGTVVWCAGMRANPLTAQLGTELDRLGRLPVDDYLQVIGSPGVFAAGDVAAARVDDDHLSVMSCQHGARWAATRATTSSEIFSGSRCCHSGYPGIQRFSTSERRVQYTPRVGIVRWSRVARKPSHQGHHQHTAHLSPIESRPQRIVGRCRAGAAGTARSRALKLRRRPRAHNTSSSLAQEGTCRCGQTSDALTPVRVRSDDPESHVDRPRNLSHCRRIAPQFRQVSGEGLQDLGLARLGGLADRRPRRDVAQHSVQIPLLPDLHRWSRQLVERKVDVDVPAVDECAFLRPVRADLGPIEALEPLIEVRVELYHPVADQRENSIVDRNPPDLVVERRAVEPVRGLRSSDQAGAPLRHGKVLGGRPNVADPVMAPGVRDLIGTGIDSDHGIEMGCELHRQLAVSTSDIDREIGRRSEGRKELRKLRRILGTKLRVGLTTTIEPVLSHHHAAKDTSAVIHKSVYRRVHIVDLGITDG